MRRISIVGVCLLSSFILAAPAKKYSSGTKTNVTQTSAESAVALSATAKKATASNTQQINDAVAKAVNDATQKSSGPSLADYIPCRFTYAELRSLQSPERATTLTEADAESLSTKVSNVLSAQQRAGAISSSANETVTQKLTKNQFLGLTPSEALSKVIATLAAVRAEELKRSTTSAKSVVQTKQDELQTHLENAAAPVIDAARDSLASLTRPDDIGCAMSILTFKEATQSYGRMIANEYIVVQVIVRNLNKDEQFVLHDVEFATITDPSMERVGRFFSGRDKVIVRALSAAQGSFDPRNLWVHGAQAIGAIMSATIPVFGDSIANAAGVYSGGFLPAFDKAWKDLSTDQLNLLNDTGFSSTQSSQTVVPKSGTVAFVTFIPSKKFSQGWWTQPCASRVYLGTMTNAIFKRGAEIETAPRPYATSVDVEHAVDACASTADSENLRASHWYGGKKDAEVEKVSTGTEGKFDVYSSVPERPFKKWSGNALALFEELSTVVVAGTHIVQNEDLQAALGDIKCDKDDAGVLKFADTDTGSLACPLTGKNLDKVNFLRLRNADDPLDTSTVNGNVTVSGGDSTAGTVTFPTAALHALRYANYRIYIVDKNGGERTTSAALHLSTDPWISSIAPAVIPPDKGTEIVVKGAHLANAKKIKLAGKTTVAAAAELAGDASQTFRLALADAKGLGLAASAPVPIVLLKDDDSTWVTAPAALLPTMGAPAAVPPVAPPVDPGTAPVGP